MICNVRHFYDNVTFVILTAWIELSIHFVIAVLAPRKTFEYSTTLVENLRKEISFVSLADVIREIRCQQDRSNRKRVGVAKPRYYNFSRHSAFPEFCKCATRKRSTTLMIDRDDFDIIIEFHYIPLHANMLHFFIREFSIKSIKIILS